MKKFLTSVSTLLLFFITACSTPNENPGTFSPSLRNPLKVDVFHASENSIFKVNSTIISGEKEAIIIDAQFEKSNAKALASKAKSLNKKVKTIFISQSDPDFYFGLAELAKAFPEAEIVSTPQTAQIIEKSYKQKQDVWNNQLKNNAPERIIIPEPIDGNKITLEGHDIQIMGLNSDDPDHTYLWMPENKLVLGGVILTEKSHLWLADFPKKYLRNDLISKLYEAKNLKPEGVIPSHSVTKNFEKPVDVSLLDENINYIQLFNSLVSNKTSTKEIVNKITEKYPDYSEKDSLKFSAEVVNQETKWTTFNSFPAYNRTVSVNYSKNNGFDYSFSPQEITVKSTKGFENINSTQTYITYLVGPQTYVITWTETERNIKVSAIFDFINETVSINYVDPLSGRNMNMTSTLVLK